MYTLRKWYFDFLTPASEYVFVYFASVRLLGKTMRSLAIHLARPSKGIRRTRAYAINHHAERVDERSRHLVQLPGGEMVIGDDECGIRFSGNECTVDLQYLSGGSLGMKPVIIDTGGTSRILWKPIGLKYRVSGRVTVGEATIDVSDSNGYVDYLESTYLPPFVPVRTLYWGRVHHSELDLAYIHAAGSGNNGAWTRLYARNDGVLTESNCLSIVDQKGYRLDASQKTCPDVYEIIGEHDLGRIRLKVHHTLPVQESGFIDQQEIRSPIARSLLKLVTRDPRSTKFLSRADIVLESGQGQCIEHDVPMIDEFALL